MDKFALLVRMNPQGWPEWEHKIGPGQESEVWFITGRRKPEEIHAGLPVVVLGTNRMGVLATGETVSAAEFRADPDSDEATDPSEQAWLKEPRDRVCIRLKGLAAHVPVEEVEEHPETARLPKVRETITWLKSHEHAALTSLVRKYNR
jgi:hypothetical protein